MTGECFTLTPIHIFFFFTQLFFPISLARRWLILHIHQWDTHPQHGPLPHMSVHEGPLEHDSHGPLMGSRLEPNDRSTRCKPRWPIGGACDLCNPHRSSIEKPPLSWL